MVKIWALSAAERALSQLVSRASPVPSREALAEPEEPLLSVRASALAVWTGGCSFELPV